jgi:hypothetical protein
METAWTMRSLATKELAVASQQCTVSHFLFHHGIFDQTQHDCRPLRTHFSVSPNEDNI